MYTSLEEARTAAPEQHFRESLTRIRTERGWSLERLAVELAAVGYPTAHASAIHRIERGEQLPRLGFACAVATALGTNLAHMLGETDAFYTDVQVERRARLMAYEFLGQAINSAVSS